MNIIDKEIISDDDKRECDKEIDIIMRANSQNIVKRFESFMADNNYYIVHEYCEVSNNVLSLSRLFCSNRDQSTLTFVSNFYLI
jgi:hypothetical protein